jgi:hypothetical protein
MLALAVLAPGSSNVMLALAALAPGSSNRGRRTIMLTLAPRTPGNIRASDSSSARRPVTLTLLNTSVPVSIPVAYLVSDTTEADRITIPVSMIVAVGQGGDRNYDRQQQDAECCLPHEPAFFFPGSLYRKRNSCRNDQFLVDKNMSLKWQNFGGSLGSGVDRCKTAPPG